MVNVEQLAQQMVAEGRSILGDAWVDARAYAEPELKKIALSVGEIELALQRKEISQEEASIMLDMQKNASRAVLMATKVIGALLAERVVGAALALAGGALDQALER